MQLDCICLFMGGTLYQREDMGYSVQPARVKKVDVNQKYFRPSCLPALNSRLATYEFFNPYYDKKPEEIHLPVKLTATPEDTVLNYFSILREAENLNEKAIGGCGTVGMSRIPYPIAYNFLSDDYQKRLGYEDFLKSFQDIGYINLIKLQRVFEDKDASQYFFEIETIEGSRKGVTYFAYYYGFIHLKKEGNHLFKIQDISLFGEDFLCAAYHGWDHDAEAVVEVKYGNWCKLVKKIYPTQQNGYVKNVYINGTDGHDYLFSL